jgi:hypothetical protein
MSWEDDIAGIGVLRLHDLRGGGVWGGFASPKIYPFGLQEFLGEIASLQATLLKATA